MNPRTHRRSARFAGIVVATSLLLAACGGGDAEDPAADPGDQTGEQATDDTDDGEFDVATASCEDDQLVTAAQDEGAVSLSGGGHTREGIEAVAASFEETYGVPVTFSRDDSGAIVQRVESELASGNLSADVVSLTDAPTFFRWAEEGVTTMVELPNEDQIIEGLRIPGVPQVPYSLVPLGVMYNGADADAPVPSTWAELADPSYEGRVVMADPNASGTALMFVSMLTELMGDEWLDQVAENDVIVTDSSLALAQLVVTGEADLGVPAIEAAVLAAQAGGEPLEIAYPEEGVPSFTADLAALTDAPNPAAAKLLVCHHLSPEFQEELVAIGGRSVLQGASQPEGAADLSEANILSPDFAALGENAEALRADFTETFDR